MTKCSTYLNLAKSNYAERNVELEVIVDFIRNDYILQESTALYQLALTKHKKEKKRNDFHAFTPAGVFKNKRNKFAHKNGEFNSTNLCFGDIDKFVNEQEVETVKQLLQQDEHIIFVKKSVSGLGLHFLFKFIGPVEKYATALLEKYNQLREKLPNFEFDFDEQVKDYSRLMLINHDAECYYEPDKPAFEPVGEAIPYEEKEEINFEIEYLEDIDATYKQIFSQFLEQKKLRFSDGQRNQCFVQLPQLSKWGLNLNIVANLLIDYVQDNNLSWGDLTEQESLDKLADCWSRYSYTVEKKITKIADDEFETYLSEKKALILKNVFTYQKVFIVAPTGAGKTTLVKEIVNEIKSREDRAFIECKADFIMPTTALVEQQTGENVETITGTQKWEQEHSQCAILGCCYNRINSLERRNSNILIVDEAHGLVTDLNWKKQTILDIRTAIERYKYVIFLSGTAEPIQNLSDFKYLYFKKKRAAKPLYQVVVPSSTEKSGLDADIEFFNQNIKDDYLNVLYKNNKNELEVLYKKFTAEGKNVVLLTSEHKHTEEYSELTTNQTLSENVDILLTTALIKEGVNILNTNKPVRIILERGADMVTIQQFAARWRKTTPEVIILHSGNLFRLEQFYISLWHDHAQYVLNQVTKIKKKIEHNDFDINREIKRVTENEYSIFRDYAGNWKINELQLMAERYENDQKNLRNNILLFKETIASLGWTESKLVVPERTVCLSEQRAEIKEMQELNREFHIQKLITNGDTRDSTIPKKLRDNYSYLIKYLSKKELEENTELLYSNSKLRLLKYRLNWLHNKNVKDISSTANEMYVLNYIKMSKLYNSIEVGREYTNEELKALCKQAELDIDCNYKKFTKDTVEVMFKVSHKREMINGKRKRKILIEEEITEENLLN